MSFTQLPNEILEVLMSPALFSTEKSILVYIARQTYGYHRETAPISRREFNQKLGISYRSINYALLRLELVHLIALVNKGNSRLSFSEWKIDVSDYLQKLVHCSALDKTGTKKVTQLVHSSARTSALQFPKNPKNSLKFNPLNKSLNKGLASNAVNNELLGNKEKAWELYSKPYLEEKRISDPYFIEITRRKYLAVGKNPTQNAVKAFIDKQQQITPDEEYFDFAKDFPKGGTK